MLENWKAYFIFSKKERKGIFVLGLMILISISLKIAFPKKTYKGTEEQNRVLRVLFDFDPNTIDSIGSMKLGFSSRQFRTLKKYREKGGKFRQPEDIKKLYGLPDSLANQFVPYIKIKHEAYKRLEVHALKMKHQYMGFKDWEGLGIFTRKQIVDLLSYKKRKGGSLSWRELVIKYDLTKQEAALLKSKTDITD